MAGGREKALLPGGGPEPARKDRAAAPELQLQGDRRFHVNEHVSPAQGPATPAGAGRA